MDDRAKQLIEWITANRSKDATVDANDLVTVIIHIWKLPDPTVRQIIKDAKTDIKVKPPEPGSQDVPTIS